MVATDCKIGDIVLVTKCDLTGLHTGHRGVLEKFDFGLRPGPPLARVRLLDSVGICYAADIEPILSVPPFNVLEQLQEDQKWWNSDTVHAPYRDEASNRAFKAGVLHGLNLAIGYLENGPD